MMAEMFKSTDVGLALTLHHSWGHYSISGQYSVQVFRSDTGDVTESESLFESIYHTVEG